MDVVLLRALERILVVLFGGFAIWLGYRLFLAIPAEKDANGRVKLPGGVEVMLARIGPGAFFALFGTVALGLSLTQPIEVDRGRSVAAREAEGSPEPASTAPGPAAQRFRGIAGPGAALPDAERDVARAEVRGLLYTLNAFERVAPDAATRAAVARDLPLVKLRLLATVWGSDWGDWAAFDAWVREQGAAEPPPAGLEAAARAFRHGAAP